MSETTTRLPRRRLRAWPASGGAVQMSATPEGADETTASPVWEVPAGDVAEAMAVLSAVADPEALDLKTQRDSLAHELENAKREITRLERERDEAREAFDAISGESAHLLEEYFQPAPVRVARCAACSQHELVDKKDAAARALAKTARRYKRERDEARDEALIESARAYSQGVEDMRQVAAQAMQVEYGLLAARVIDGLSVSAQTPPPAPRDSHMTSEVRALVKRYGAPAIAAEAARQAKEEGR
jgi:hypothetical protein